MCRRGKSVNRGACDARHRRSSRQLPSYPNGRKQKRQKGLYFEDDEKTENWKQYENNYQLGEPVHHFVLSSSACCDLVVFRPVSGRLVRVGFSALSFYPTILLYPSLSSIIPFPSPSPRVHTLHASREPQNWPRASAKASLYLNSQRHTRHMWHVTHRAASSEPLSEPIRSFKSRQCEQTIIM